MVHALARQYFEEGPMPQCALQTLIPAWVPCRSTHASVLMPLEEWVCSGACNQLFVMSVSASLQIEENRSMLAPLIQFLCRLPWLPTIKGLTVNNLPHCTSLFRNVLVPARPNACTTFSNLVDELIILLARVSILQQFETFV
jgi:hypothetical protein